VQCVINESDARLKYIRAFVIAYLCEQSPPQNAQNHENVNDNKTTETDNLKVSLHVISLIA